jgi:hypothetical protein
MRKTLQELEKLISIPSKDSKFFHEMTDILLVDYLLFIKTEEIYQVDTEKPSPPTKIVEAKNIDEVRFVCNELLSQGITPRDYARRFTYERSTPLNWRGDRVTTFSHHKTLEDLLNDRLHARSILSTTDFDLGKRKLSIEDTKRLFGLEAELRGIDSVGVAFERDYIVITQDATLNDLYCLHPKQLYEAAKKYLNPF